MDYSALPTEIRMMALGLPICATSPPAGAFGRPVGRRRGRRRVLSMLERIEVAITWGEHMNAHARIVVPRERGQVRKLQQKLVAARMNGDAQFLLDRMSARLDRLGRMTSEIVLPPEIALPEADKAIAKRYGITARMVRKIRSDKGMQIFMPHPVWRVRDWEKRGAERYVARSIAKQRMTPERYAKNEQVALVSDGLVVEQDSECFRWDGSAHRFAQPRNGRLQPPRPRQRITHDDVYKAALRASRLMQRLERLMPPEYRRRPAWLGFQRQWARMEARCEGWFSLGEQQIYFWRRHPEGRRIAAKISDDEAEKCDHEYWADRTRK